MFSQKFLHFQGRDFQRNVAFTKDGNIQVGKFEIVAFSKKFKPIKTFKGIS